MKNTKQINPIRILKASKFIKKKYDEDLVKVSWINTKKMVIVMLVVVSDSVWLDKKKQ